MKELKSTYIAIFSVNYFFQGIAQGLYAVIIPIFLFDYVGGIDGSTLSLMFTVVLLPFAIKFLYGIISDKVSFKKYGRRKPWIIIPVSIAGFFWIILQLFISPNNAIILFIIAGVILILGIAMADTAIDGLILDICPKEGLGRVQGICWSFRSIGTIAGGPLIVTILQFINIQSIFILYGFILISSSFLVLIVKESALIDKINIKKNVKEIFGKGKNWKVFTFALFISIVDGVIFTLISLYIIILQPDLGLGMIGGVIELDALQQTRELYIINASISVIIGIGVIIGAVIGGRIADLKSRKKSVYSSLIITTISFLLFLIPVHYIENAHLPYIILLIFAGIVGSTNGWRKSAYSAVIGQISKQYPEANSTYFATCNSFTNGGTILGLTLTGILLGALQGLDVYMTFSIIFVFMIIASNISLIPFMLINSKDYELKPQS
ncbi:MAG: MFS transporter [Candidatus Lokiarchaeota archaeon]|nr:MFS transporter [Candidatus Lokiarchaeota archaeon]